MCYIYVVGHQRSAQKSQSVCIEQARTGFDSHLTKKEINYIMTFNKRLSPWIIVRLLPNMQRVVVGQFRKRSDAEGHLQALRRLLPDAQLIIVFDVEE
jgi:hypothetical protein